MATDYERVWESMNSVEQVTSKIVSAREILESSLDSLERHEYGRTEALIVAAQEFLDYYLKEFDETFKVAWKETVVKSKEDGFYWDTDSKGNLIDWLANPHLTEDRIDNFPVNWTMNHDCMDNSVPDYIPSSSLEWQDEITTTPKKTWKLPVEQIVNETGEDEYFITLPDEILAETGWDEGTELIWSDNGDGSFSLSKV